VPAGAVGAATAASTLALSAIEQSITSGLEVPAVVPPRPSKRFPQFNATVFALDVCALQHPAVATTKQITAILRITISSKDSPLLIFFILILGIFRGFQCSGHHLERSRALLFEFGGRRGWEE